jgi:hypothetical protein
MNKFVHDLCLSALVFGSVTVLAQTPGVWTNVTPSGMNINATGQPNQGQPYVGPRACWVDPARPTDVYVGVYYDGIWKSTDYGVTFRKVNTGVNGDLINTGAPGFAYDENPGRDPSTPLTFYVSQLNPTNQGKYGLYKTMNGGVDWTQVWNGRVYAADGVTNISADVGGDVGGFQIIDPLDKNHLIASLHSYWGAGGNNGVFESTDGGEKWILHNATSFSFQPHNSILSAFDKSTWIVTPNTISSSMDMYRTTDGGGHWTNIGPAPARGLGIRNCKVGSTTYSGTDYNQGGVCKTTDKGLSWSPLPGSGNAVSWVVATATKLYACAGPQGSTPHIMIASLSNDTSWTSTTCPMNQAGNTASVTFDGKHYIIIAAHCTAGVWRYIEPSSGSEAAQPLGRVNNAKRYGKSMMYVSGARSHINIRVGARFYNTTGQQLHSNAPALIKQ